MLCTSIFEIIIFIICCSKSSSVTSFVCRSTKKLCWRNKEDLFWNKKWLRMYMCVCVCEAKSYQLFRSASAFFLNYLCRQSLWICRGVRLFLTKDAVLWRKEVLRPKPAWLFYTQMNCCRYRDTCKNISHDSSYESIYMYYMYLPIYIECSLTYWQLNETRAFSCCSQIQARHSSIRRQRMSNEANCHNFFRRRIRHRNVVHGVQNNAFTSVGTV